MHVACRTARRRTVDASAGYLPAVRLALLTLLWTGSLAAQTIPNGGTRVTVAGDREVIALSTQPTARAVTPSVLPRFTAQSHETLTQRIHVVTYEGETFSAATPLEGPESRIAFDPARRTFAPLLPSIRVELSERVQIGAVAAEVGATGITVFESLGFAILDLPEELHPADAVARISTAFGATIATVRLRGPRIEWR